jgi:hypothetical protein
MCEIKSSYIIWKKKYDGNNKYIKIKRKIKQNHSIILVLIFSPWNNNNNIKLFIQSFFINSSSLYIYISKSQTCFNHVRSLTAAVTQKKKNHFISS